MSKKQFFIILLLISVHVRAFAQSPFFYYYKGSPIPLSLNENKVCVSFPNDKGIACNDILSNINVLDTIRDDFFNISIIQQSDVDKLTASANRKKEFNSMLISPTFFTEEGNEVFLTPYLSVRLKREEDYNILLSYVEKYNLRIVKKNSFLPLWYLLSISHATSMNTLDVANAIWESNLFAASVPDLSSVDLSFCSNDPLFDNQWGLFNSSYPNIDISVCPAWNYCTGKNVRIAIIDTGIKKNHRDLSENILDELSYNTETGYSSYSYEGDHGTHCAGIIAAIKDNDIDIAGVAPEAKIIPIHNTLEATAGIQHQLADGIMWAYLNGADIISCSWGVPTKNSIIDEAIHSAFTYGRNGKGCVITFATGKSGDNFISYPANCNDTILAVGAINEEGLRCSFSNYGGELDLVAPGEHIISTVVDHNVGYMNGTSMACPHVAGVAALILERNPELSVTQVNSIICRNAKKLSNVAFDSTRADGPWNEQYGYGLVDAYNSVKNTPHIVYLQNDTIMGTTLISADTIYVGKDVTDTNESGDVIIGPGNITLEAKSVNIKNSTRVPINTRLKIQNQQQ